MDEKRGQSIGDRLRGASSQRVRGREAELARLERCCEPGEPALFFVHGSGGIGKSALLHALVPRLQARGVRVVVLDGRELEPTAEGFLRALAEQLGTALPTLTALRDVAGPLLLAIDEFDSLRLLEGFLRRALIEPLPASCRVLLLGRHPPPWTWLSSPGWSDLLCALPLRALAPDAARELLPEVPEARRDELVALTGGHPLALTLAARVAQGSFDTEDVLASLLERLLEDVRDAELARALEAASVLRRASAPLLAALLGVEVAPLLERMLALPFVERAQDGVWLHESVRAALEARLRMRDAGLHRSLRTAAHRALRSAFASAYDRDAAWRVTADLLFLVPHQLLREAFFPRSASRLAVEPACPDDRAAVLALAPDLEPWWQLAPQAFEVARDEQGRVRGVCAALSALATPRALVDADPLLAAWLADWRASEVARQDVLFTRGVFHADEPARAALWIAIKRRYLENIALGAVYVAHEGELDASVAALGFRPLPGREETLRNAFGPAGITGWLGRLIEDGGEPFALDVERRALIVDGDHVALTPLEHGTLGYLFAARGRVVTRDELLKQVWRQDFGGSNVVDAMMRGLRKKLGRHAAALETVKGFGYRLR